MIRHDEYAQGSVEWALARAGLPTASQFDRLVTHKWEIRTGEMPKTYLAELLAEWWQGGPLPSYNSFDMEQGSILEEYAKPFFSITYGLEIESVGFLTTDDGRVGCSPDGILPNEAGLEIKCPAVQTHTKYLMAGQLPPEYAAQVQGGMFVTGWQQWEFLSYCRRFPPLRLVIERDEKAQSALGESLEMFLEKLEAGKDRLCELHGGPPPRLVQNRTLETVSANHDPDDYRV